MVKAEFLGRDELISWFGQLPTFHDAEILEMNIKREPEDSDIIISYWKTSSALDQYGNFKKEKNAIVKFIFSEIFDLKIESWNHQNVVSHLTVESLIENYKIIIEGTFGVSACIICSNLRAEIRSS